MSEEAKPSLNKYKRKPVDSEGRKLPDERTIQIYLLGAQGLTAKEIADELGISEPSVERERKLWKATVENLSHTDTLRAATRGLVPRAIKRSREAMDRPGGSGDQVAVQILKGTGALVDRQQIDQQQTQLTVELVAQLAHSLPQLMEIPALRRQLQPVLLEMSKSMLSQQQAHTPDSEERPGGSERGSSVSVDDSKPKPDTEVANE